MRQVIVLAMVFGALGVSLYGQGLGQSNGFVPGGPELGGWRLYNVGVTGLYYYGTPPISTGVSPSSNPQSGGGGGAQVALGWTRVHEKTSASLGYNASYYATAGDSSWRALSQQLGLSLRQKLSGKWSLEAAVSGSVATANEYLYSPTALSAISSVPATFDDLAKSMLGGAYANNQLAFATLAAPGTDPAARALYGNRSYAFSGGMGLSYRPSQRWTWGFKVSGSRVESLNSGVNEPATNPVIPASTLLSASIAAEYSLTPRTSLGFMLGDNKVTSQIEETNNTSGTVSVRRTLSRRWLAEAHGGISKIIAIRTTYEQPSGPGYTAGGSLAFKTRSNTLMGSVNRVLGDTYGLGASSSLTASGSWNWAHPGSSWRAHGTFSWQRFQQGADFSNWVISAGVGRVLNAHFRAQGDFAFTHFTQGSLYGNQPDQRSVRASLLWSPQPTSIAK